MSPSAFFMALFLSFLMPDSSWAIPFKSKQRENFPLELLEDCDSKIHFPASFSSAGCARGLEKKAQPRLRFFVDVSQMIYIIYE
jgi:hypothetical protein